MVFKKTTLVSFILCFAIITTSLVASIDVSGEIHSEKKFEPSKLGVLELLPDPDMDSTPNVQINGSFGEFASDHISSTGPDSISYVEFTWTHVAGTSPEPAAYDPNLPFFKDVIYLEQSFDWTYDDLPSAVSGKLNYSVTTTGDFSTPSGSLMFQVYCWLIDSSGNWNLIYSSYPTYTGLFQEYETYTIHPAYIEAWAEIFGDSDGVQDPEDTISFAIGLAPTMDFYEGYEYMGEDPWQYYDGVVTVRIDSANLYAFMDVEPEPDEVLQHLHNETWGSLVNETFPDVPPEYNNAIDFCYGIAVGEDGSIYVLVTSSTPFQLIYSTGEHYYRQVILKYDSEFNLIWCKNNRNMTTGMDICYKDGYIYTTGTNFSMSTDEDSLLVTKWDSDGNIIWESTWPSGIISQGGSIDVAENGDIYVLGVHLLLSEPHFGLDSENVLLKFNANGLLEWNITITSGIWLSVPEVEIVADGLYTSNGTDITFRDFNGIAKWTAPCNLFSVDDSGNLITIMTLLTETGRTVQFNKTNIDGDLLWSTNFSIDFFPDWGEWLECVSVATASDGSVIAHIGNVLHVSCHYLIKLSSDGEYLWHKIIGSDNWLPPYASFGFLIIAPNDVVYLAVNLYSFDISILSYDVGVTVFIFPIELVLIAAGGISIVAISIVLVKRRGRVDYYSEYKERYDL